MNLSYLAATADVSVGISFPVWIAWGLGFAAILTVGLFLAGFLLDIGSDGLIGFDSSSIFKILGNFFVFYGLIPGLSGSLLAFYTSWVWGALETVVALVVIVVLHNNLNSRIEKRRNVVPRFQPPKKSRRGNSVMLPSFRD